MFSSTPVAANEKEFRMGVIGPAELSLATSRIAVSKATNKNAKEFAGIELGEAIVVTGVLKDLVHPYLQWMLKQRQHSLNQKHTGGTGI